MKSENRILKDYEKTQRSYYYKTVMFIKSCYFSEYFSIFNDFLPQIQHINWATGKWVVPNCSKLLLNLYQEPLVLLFLNNSFIKFLKSSYNPKHILKLGSIE